MSETEPPDHCLPAAARRAAALGQMDQWVQKYLSQGQWANPGLRDGLALVPRFWIGPLRLPLADLQRSVGPNPRDEFHEPAEIWIAGLDRLARLLRDPETVPPLIAEWRRGVLSLRDGNHRHGAMQRLNWSWAWTIVWCNSRADAAEAQQFLNERVQTHVST